MAATNRSKDDLINESTGLYKDNTAGDISAADLRDGIYSIFQPQGICQGRLTLESGVPVSTSDQTAKTNVYFTPYLGNCIGLYDGTSWKLHTFTEKTLALGTLTSGLPYDVFIYDNAGTLTLDTPTAWTNGTTRATALTTQDGVYVKTGATTRRYLGTFYTTSTTTTEDSGGGVTTVTGGKRFLWNLYNQVERHIAVHDTTNSWTYNSATLRSFNNSTGNRVEYIAGIAGAVVKAEARCWVDNNDTSNPLVQMIGIGLDSTSANSARLILGGSSKGGIGVGGAIAASSYAAPASLGYHFLQMLEATNSGAPTATFYGDAGISNFQSGLQGTVWC